MLLILCVDFLLLQKLLKSYRKKFFIHVIFSKKKNKCVLLLAFILTYLVKMLQNYILYSILNCVYVLKCANNHFIFIFGGPSKGHWVRDEIEKESTPKRKEFF